MEKMGTFTIYDFRFIIDYFLVAFLSHRAVPCVAKTTVLIGVNPCLRESCLKKQSQYCGSRFRVQSSAFKAKRSDLKKQSQFAEGENEHKISHNKGLRRNSMF
jgi:hypothetical protein